MRVRIPAQLSRIVGATCLLSSLILGGAAQAAPLGERYFIEFRSRPSSHIGHTYIVFGRLAGRGRAAESHYAGLIPDSDGWNGLITPIKGSIRRYKDDVRMRPDAVYRRTLSVAEYQRVSRAVRTLRRLEHEWHAVFFNCNDFGIEIAEALGLYRPPSLMPPNAWVTLLRKLNEPGQ